MQTLKNIQTKDYIAQAIRDEILSGHIDPGEELAQEALAEMLGVSRMPVREALQTLVQEGFAIRLPNRHIQAVVLDAAQIHDTFRVIAATEAEYLMIGAEREAGTGEKRKLKEQEETALSDKVTELGMIVEKMGEAEDPAEMIRLEKEFHDLVLRLPENPYLEQLEKRAVDGYVAYVLENCGDKEKAHQLLARLVRAARKQDEGSVRSLLKEYYMMYADDFAGRWNR